MVSRGSGYAFDLREDLLRCGTLVRSDFENSIQQVPDRFLFTVFGSHWRKVRLNQQLYCKPLAPLAEPFSTWAAELENATVADCIAASFHRLGKG